MRYNILTASAFAGLATAAPSEDAAVHQLSKRFLSDNWCGAVQSTKGVKELEATWTVPTISIPSNATTTDHFSSYQWIGMGGVSACAARTDLLQAGTGAEIVNGGDPFYYAYYQLYGSSGPMINTLLTIFPGDSVYVKVTRDTTTSGTFYWENLTTGKNSSQKLTSSKGRTICQKSLEWIHERPGYPRRPFPDFTKFSFTGISGTYNDGTYADLTGSEDWIMTKDQTNFRLCHPHHNSATSMSIIQDNEWSD